MREFRIPNGHISSISIPFFFRSRVEPNRSNANGSLQNHALSILGLSLLPKSIEFSVTSVHSHFVKKRARMEGLGLHKMASFLMGSAQNWRKTKVIGLKRWNPVVLARRKRTMLIMMMIWVVNF
ncbi:hypothetical protein PanWU01x14_158040 [Parasponia andersonii]|uniref:Uncharacterized protein n=1 Tax=Parasponia andersonii TaxID=3476 RepID=A0A2P5CEX1_PARAD|nr:hypothetical protein PanWU01x14_158040 [Parasponia andersonii]